MDRSSIHRRRRHRRGACPRPRPRPTPYSPERRVASSVPTDRPLSPPSYASVVRRGLGTPPPEPQRGQESGPAADSNAPENQKPGPPTSPPLLPSSMNLNLPDASRGLYSFLPTPSDASIAGCGAHAPLQLQHQEESESGSELDRSPKYSSSDEEDAYFKSLVDNFVTVAANTFIYTSSDDEIDYKLADQRHSVMYAEHALKHYNNDEKNEVKYELISGITSSDMLIMEGCFGHVNFTAKGNQHNSKEELFFAELHWDGDTPVPTCVISLEGMKYTGGLRDSRYDKFYVGDLPKDDQNCYSCRRHLKHPKNGKLYKMGHIATSYYYTM